MTSLAILHAPGDEAAAHALCARLSAQRPIACPVGVGQSLRLGAHVTLIVVWSRLAQTQRTAAEFGEICLRHDGLVMVCPVDDALFPEELDDADYRLIDPSVDEAILLQAKRAHDIVANAARGRRETLREEVARRERTPNGQAFAGGAFTGFATTVALFGAMGATAIGAVDQWGGSADQSAEQPPPNMRVLRGIPAAPDHSAWADVAPQPAPTPQALAAADDTLAAAAARIAELRATTEPARERLENIAAGELWSPPTRAAARPTVVKPAAHPEAPAPREFARAENVERAAAVLQVARFTPFEIEPCDFAPISELDLGADAKADLSLDGRLDTQLDWSAAAELEQISYRAEPDSDQDAEKGRADAAPADTAGQEASRTSAEPHAS